MALTRVQYLRLATGLPVVVPIVFGTGSLLLLSIVDDVGHMLLRQSWRTHAVGIVLVPCLMIPALGAFSFITGDQSLTLWEAMQSAVAPCLEIGYPYVALTFAGMWILSRTGRVEA
jgi:hypothetical protein